MTWMCTGGQKGIKGFNSNNHFKVASLYFKHILITKGLMSQSSNFFIRGKISIFFKDHHGYIIYSLFNKICLFLWCKLIHAILNSFESNMNQIFKIFLLHDFSQNLNYSEIILFKHFLCSYHF